MKRLTIYSKPDCHLCDEMKAVVTNVVVGHGDISVETVDISADPVLHDRYGLEIPVLMIDGRKVAKYRVTGQELTKILEGKR